MKNTKFWVLLMLPALFLLVSCDEDVLDVTETFSFTEEFVVVSEGTEFSLQQVVNLTQDDQSVISQYGNKIKKIEVEQVRYWIKAHEGSDEQTLVMGEIKVAHANGSNETSVAVIENKVLAALLDNPTELALNEAGIGMLEDLTANSPHSFSFAVHGEVNEGPLDFTMVIEVHAKMTANPLN